MEITLRLKDVGDTKLFLQPKEDMSSPKKDINEFILVRSKEDFENPYMCLTIDKKGMVSVTEQRDIDEEDSFLKDKLAYLAIHIIEALQQGVDLAAIDIPETSKSVKPYDPELIRVEPSNLSLRQVFDMIKDGEINLSPDFQRNVVWDNRRKSKLIESILLRIPLPVFYFSSDRDGILSVVDGLQRLTAINEFMQNRLVLHDLEYLDSCEGQTYSGRNRIDDRLFRRFNLTQISANVIDSSSPTKVKYDIFRRLNTGGRPLNAQELRNCLASNKLRSALRGMAKSKEFLATTTHSVSDVRMDAQEYALRFIRFRMLNIMPNHSIRDYSGNMDDELDNSVEILNGWDTSDFEEYAHAYDTAMVNARHLFGNHAFRKVFEDTHSSSYRSVINKALFLSWSVLLADIETEMIKKKFKKNSWISILGEKISSDEYYYRMLSYGTNGWKNIVVAFDTAKAIIDAQLNL
jgi:hypothetical protein